MDSFKYNDTKVFFFFFFLVFHIYQIEKKNLLILCRGELKYVGDLRDCFD